MFIYLKIILKVKKIIKPHRFYSFISGYELVLKTFSSKMTIDKENLIQNQNPRRVFSF